MAAAAGAAAERRGAALPRPARRSRNAGNGAVARGAARRDARSGVAPTAERQLVSVLFADLVGFTPFAEERDAEDVRETLTRYFDLATRGDRALRRHRREVHRRRGDGRLGRADRPRGRRRAGGPGRPRARRRGRDRSGPAIQARAGVLTGEAAVTLGATNQGMVAGDLVNTAARLQAAAAAGHRPRRRGDLPGRERRDRLRGRRRADAQGQGRAGPGLARAARRRRARRPRTARESLEAPFVGRDDRAPAAQGPVPRRPARERRDPARQRRRHRRASARAGSPGSSRSTSTASTRRSCGTTAARPAYGQGVTFWSLGEMVRGRAGLARDGRRRRRPAPKIAAMLDDVMPGEPEPGAGSSRRCSSCSAIGRRRRSRRRELFGAWRAFFEALSARGTVVLVFQDVHWADSGHARLHRPPRRVVARVPDLHPLARPPGAARRAARLGRRPAQLHERVPGAAPQPTMRELLDGPRPGPARSRRSRPSSAQAEGMPLYAVEIVRMLVERGRPQPEPDGTFGVHGDVSRISRPGDADGAHRRPAGRPRARGSRAAPRRGGPRPELHAGGPRGGERSERRRGRAAARGADSARAAPARRGRALAGARPVRVHAGARARDRLQHARAEGSPDAPPRGGALVRDPRRAASSSAPSPATSSPPARWRREARRPTPSPPRRGSRSRLPAIVRRPSDRTARRSTSTSRRSR